MHVQGSTVMYLSMSSWQGGGRDWGIGQGFDQLLWPGVGELNYLAVPGGRDV